MSAQEKRLSKRERIAERDAADQKLRDTEVYVRGRMKPELVASAKKAVTSFKLESFGLFEREK